MLLTRIPKKNIVYKASCEACKKPVGETTDDREQPTITINNQTIVSGHVGKEEDGIEDGLNCQVSNVHKARSIEITEHICTSREDKTGTEDEAKIPSERQTAKEEHIPHSLTAPTGSEQSTDQGEPIPLSLAMSMKQPDERMVEEKKQDSQTPSATRKENSSRHHQLPQVDQGS